MPDISVVTGGTGGMGLTIAKHLAKSTKVILCDLSVKGYERVKDSLEGLDVTFVEGNCTNPADMQHLAEIAAAAGEIKNVIHTAGVSEYTAGKKNTPEFIAEINISSYVNVVNTFLPVIAAGGTLVSIASMTSYVDLEFHQYGDAFPAAVHGDYTKLLEYGAGGSTATYAITKAFMRWYCCANICRAAARGATINTISPGIVETPMTAAIEEKSPGSISSMKYIVPAGRLGNTEDIAVAVDFLTHAPYISGADILVDGGYTNSIKVEQVES